MILSASRRTDIPAFWGDWFLDRFKRGFVSVRNPFNSKMYREISLKKEEVDAFVFWTRYPLPFFRCLDAIDDQGTPYYFLITINDYPRWLEPHIPERKDIISSLKKLYSRIGKFRIIWRYDPVIISNITPLHFHKENFFRLAQMIAPYSFRVIISFLDFYYKVTRRFRKIPYQLYDIRNHKDKLEDLINFFYRTAEGFGLEIQSCAEDLDGIHAPLKGGKCLDEELLKKVFGLKLRYKKDNNQRPRCLCQQSVDIGTYGTCGFNCLYCYTR